MELFTNYLYQVVFTVGVIVLFGFLIALCRRGFCALMGRSGPTILLITGAVGTPIHELSHALFCLIFGHKIREIKLYRPGANDGALGYVTHTFNPKNIYHQIGNFFIGIAPILGGSGMLMLLALLMVPQTFGGIMSDIGSVGGFAGADGLAFAGELFAAAWSIFLRIFDFSDASNAWRWIFIVLALMISSHMELSGADIKGGIKGLFILLGIILVVDTALYFIYLLALVGMTSAFISAGIALMSFLMMAGIFSLALLLIALVVKMISIPFKK